MYAHVMCALTVHCKRSLHHCMNVHTNLLIYERICGKHVANKNCVLTVIVSFVSSEFLLIINITDV